MKLGCQCKGHKRGCRCKRRRPSQEPLGNLREGSLRALQFTVTSYTLQSVDILQTSTRQDKLDQSWEQITRKICKLLIRFHVPCFLVLFAEINRLKILYCCLLQLIQMKLAVTRGPCTQHYTYNDTPCSVKWSSYCIVLGVLAATLRSHNSGKYPVWCEILTVKPDLSFEMSFEKSSASQNESV